MSAQPLKFQWKAKLAIDRLLGSICCLHGPSLVQDLAVDCLKLLSFLPLSTDLVARS